MSEKEVPDIYEGESLLKVVGKKRDSGQSSYVKSLAMAILDFIEEYGQADLRSVGITAAYHAQKAITIASHMSMEDGVQLVAESKFFKVDFDGQVKTGFLTTVYPKK